MKKTACLVFLLIAVLLVVSVNFSVLADPEDEPITNDAISFYEEPEKIDTVLSPESIIGITVNATYSFTENLSETEVASRSDVYGTYDVYTDADGSQYVYLYDTQMLCGCVTYEFPEIADADRIDETEAISIADDFFSVKYPNQSGYSFDSCTYNECSEEYLIEYAYYVDGYKTDATFDVWLDAAGGVFAYTEFYKNRYINLSIPSTAYASAESAVDTELSNAYSSYELKKEYVTIDDTGALRLVKLVSFAVDTGYGEVINAAEHSAVISQ